MNTILLLLIVVAVTFACWWLSREIFWPARRLCRTNPHVWQWDEEVGRQCSRCGLRDY